MIIREAKYKDYPKIKILAQKYNLSIYEKKEWEEIWINNTGSLSSPCDLLQFLELNDAMDEYAE